MVPIIAQTSEMILVTVAQKVAIARLVLLPILEVVDSDIRISDVTHLWFSFLIILVISRSGRNLCFQVGLILN